MIAAVHSFERHWKQVFAVSHTSHHVTRMSHEGFSDSGTRVFLNMGRPFKNFIKVCLLRLAYPVQIKGSPIWICLCFKNSKSKFM